MSVRLYGYWRSSTSYRARIGLNLKQIEWEYVPVNLVAGEQNDPAYQVVNPQALVPVLDYHGTILTQSGAMLDFLDEMHPAPPFLPEDPVDRARVRAMCQLIACEIHPIANMSPLKYLKERLAHSQAEVDDWYRHWVVRGLNALEALVRPHYRAGAFSYGAELTLADVFLVPQMYNARRFNSDLAGCPTLVDIDRRLQDVPEIALAAPERQPDAP